MEKKGFLHLKLSLNITVKKKEREELTVEKDVNEGMIQRCRIFKTPFYSHVMFSRYHGLEISKRFYKAVPSSY